VRRRSLAALYAPPSQDKRPCFVQGATQETSCAVPALGVGNGQARTYHLRSNGPEATTTRHFVKRGVEPRGLMNPEIRVLYAQTVRPHRPMKKEFITPPGQAIPRGAYTPAIKVDLGSATMLFVTGQLALDPQSRVVAPFDAAAQTEYIFNAVSAILQEAGMTLADVVRTQTYLTDMADYPKFTAVRDRHLAESRPASTLLEVKGLAHPGNCIEIEFTAIRANSAP